MKFVVLTIQSSKELWLSEAIKVYSEKINRYQKLEFIELKSIKMERKSQTSKVDAESAALMNQIQFTDILVLFDQRGRSFSSERFSDEIVKLKNLSAKRIVFIIGGAFGVSDQVRQKAHLSINLSPMIFNHHVALLVVLEQIYRAISIEKNLPYHNP